MDIDTNHFHYGLDGEIELNPWMQLRSVAVESLPAASGFYAVSGGWNKNDLVQTLQVAWMNDTPLDALVYGEVTRGGTKVTLQAVSTGGLLYQHGRSTVPGPITLVDASILAVGVNVGRDGTLGQNTALAISEVRQSSVTMPLCPESTGLVRIAPGQTFTGRVDCRFVTSVWQGGDPDGGAAGAESTFTAGELTLELFALPYLG